MTSTLNLPASSSIHAQNAAKSVQNTAASENNAGVPGEFSAMFAALMTGKPGQQVADLEGKTSPPAQLAAEALSPAVNIITTTDTVTSDDSLIAFARAQGLDDTAMALIFNATPAYPAGLASAYAFPAMAGSGGGPATPNGAQTSENPLPLAPTLSALAGLASEGGSSWSIGKAGLAESQQMLANGGLKPVLFGLNGVRAAISMDATPAAQASADGDSGEVQTQSLAATLILGAAEAAQWSKRFQIRTAGLRAEHLAQSFSRLSTKTPLNDTPALPATLLETLAIGQEISGDDLPAIWAQRLGTGGQPDQSSAGGSDEASHAEQALRSEQYEKLSQRLGEALGQRLAAQIARGEWKVELAVNPHKLGKIDIQLDMRQGELEASFKTSNPMTRELLVDSMPRLKEVLAQAGMEVAGLNVNLKQDRQNGGNPTPGRQQQAGQPVSGVNDKVTSNPVSGPVATGKQTDSDTGLDVLV